MVPPERGRRKAFDLGGEILTNEVQAAVQQPIP